MRPQPWLALADLGEGETLAKCKVCPKFRHDARHPENPACHSGIVLSDNRALALWAREHAKTDMHRWYLSAPLAEITAEERLLASIFVSGPKAMKVAFPHLSRRGQKAYPTWGMTTV